MAQVAEHFDKGDKVIATRGVHDRTTVVPKGAVGTVRCVDRDPLLLVDFPGHKGAGEGGSVKTWDHEITHADAPSWSDVAVGDKVTARHEVTGDEVVITAYASSTSGSVMVLDSFAGHKGTRTIQGLEVVSIEKPKPKLPTTPGSTIKSVDVNNDLAVLLGRGVHAPAWRWASNGLATSPDRWKNGWTLDRDLGEEGS